MSYVIHDPEWGIFLGHCMGLSFWSQLDPVGQEHAVTFPSVEEAETFMASWIDGRPEHATLVPVTTAEDGYASMQECVDAGLDGWLDELMPAANALPC